MSGKRISMHGVFLRVLTFPRTVLTLVLLATLLFALALPRLEKHTDVASMLPENHPTVQFCREVENEFGIRESLLIGVVKNSDGGITTPGTLAFIHRLTEKLRGMPAIKTGSVKGLFTIDDIVGTPEGFEVVPLLETIPRTDEEVSALRRRIRRNRMLQGEIVSRDGTGTLIYADLEPDADKAAVYREVKSFIESENKDPEREVFIAGMPVFQGVIGIYVDRELKRVFPLTGLVVVAMLGLLLRSLRGIILPLLVVLFSVIWTMGAMALLGIPIYTMTTAVPIIIMALGCADGIHVLTRYDEAAREEPRADRKRIILVTMDEMWSPVVMTSLTTTVGFLSLLSSDMEPLRYFGIFSAFGVLAAMVISLTFLPAMLVLLKRPRQTAGERSRAPSSPQHAAGGSLARIFHEVSGLALLNRFGRGVYDHRRSILAANLALVALSLFGLCFLRVDADPMRYFRAGSEIPAANEMLNRKFNGTGLLCMVLDAGEPDGFKSPRLLRKLETLQERLKDRARDVGGSVSLVDYIKLMNRATNGDDPARETVPETREEVAQYLLLYSMSGDTEDLDQVVDYAFQRANLIIRLKTLSSLRVGRVVHITEELAREIFQGEDVDFKVGGRAKLIFLMMDFLVKGQIYSILLSMIGVFLITTLMFRSGWCGVLNLLPILVASIWNFGIMSLFRMPLEPSTAVTACIGIGVGIDYSIHFISKYRRLVARARPGPYPPGSTGGVYRELTARTMETAGKAILFNALVVIFGFLVLLFSTFPPTRNMGIMVSLNMFTCFIGAVTLLPASLNWIRPRNCRVC